MSNLRVCHLAQIHLRFFDLGHCQDYWICVFLSFLYLGFGTEFSLVLCTVNAAHVNYSINEKKNFFKNLDMRVFHLARQISIINKAMHENKIVNEIIATEFRSR